MAPTELPGAGVTISLMSEASPDHASQSGQDEGTQELEGYDLAQFHTFYLILPRDKAASFHCSSPQPSPPFKRGTPQLAYQNPHLIDSQATPLLRSHCHSYWITTAL